MKNVQLQSLTLRNFKGIKSLKIDFNPHETFIHGDNGTGKTTVFDAFNWLLWGKNSENKTDFDIKTLDSENNPIHELEHEVLGELDLNGERTILRRVYTENWVKRHGNDFKELTGHKTDLYVNDVPVQLNEYKKIINDMIPDSLSRLLTDPLYFNTHLDWKQRRLILTEIAGEISDQEIIDSIPKFESIQEIFNSGKTIEQKKAEISPKIKKMKEELKLIPARIDEQDRSRPENENFEQLEFQLSDLKTDLEQKNKIVESVLNQINEFHRKDRERLNKIQSLKTEIQVELSKATEKQNESRLEALKKENGLKSRLNELNSEKQFQEIEIKNFQNLNARLENENDKLKNDFIDLKAKELKPGEIPTSCSSCGTVFSEQKINEKSQELIDKYNLQKATDLRSISQKAQNNKDVISINNTNIQSLKNKIDGIDTLIENLNKSIQEVFIPQETQCFETPKTIEIQKQIEIIEKESTEFKEEDTTETKIQITELKNQIQEIENKLRKKDEIARIEARIKQLQSEQLKISQEIASLEQIDFLMDEFTRVKMQTVENKVNSLFTVAQFKMFETQVNGVESPTCVCMYNGVPFGSLNYAMKPNVGLDIIRVLQDFHQIKAPIFIDNRESISEILNTGSQVVNLVKITGQKELVIK